MSAILKKCKHYDISPAVLGLSKVSKRNPKPNKRKSSEYGQQLNEKQKLKFIYDVGERQFRNYFEESTKDRHKTGERLLQLLELRLDSVIYRLGFAKTRREARQLVVHGHFLINGKKINIPSYRVKPSDNIEVKENSKKSPKFKAIFENINNIIVPVWLEVDQNAFIGKVLRLPNRDEIDTPVEEYLVVVLYSK